MEGAAAERFQRGALETQDTGGEYAERGMKKSLEKSSSCMEVVGRGSGKRAEVFVARPKCARIELVCDVLGMTASYPKNAQTVGRSETAMSEEVKPVCAVPPFLLINPHEKIQYTAKGKSAIVAGRYEYHHYLQDAIEDSGWGCAYRSFQTVWSWFRLQRYTDKAVPTHRAIQQCLVDIGDKPEKFVGSRQWIGSVELGFCLETMMGVSSRILSSRSGEELAEHARALIFHFENNGAPVMIGGGQLAHTILGVDYNVRSGECHFLVLDPHYTGGDTETDLGVIVKKGWCGWKPMKFWDKKSFYNLLLPITPSEKMPEEELEKAPAAGETG